MEFQNGELLCCWGENVKLEGIQLTNTILKCGKENLPFTFAFLLRDCLASSNVSLQSLQYVQARNTR